MHQVHVSIAFNFAIIVNKLFMDFVEKYCNTIVMDNL